MPLLHFHSAAWAGDVVRSTLVSLGGPSAGRHVVMELVH